MYFNLPYWIESPEDDISFPIYGSNIRLGFLLAPSTDPDNENK